MPTYHSSEMPLQGALVAALRADVTLMALVTAVEDHVPAKRTYPYVVIADLTSLEFDTKTSTGEEVTVTLHAWSQHSGRKEILQIHGELKRILHDQLLAVTDHYTVLMRREYFATFTEPDNVTRHGVSRFRALVQAA